MAVTTTGTTRMQSFPFDSKFDGYDSDGYPVYDRAVGASLLRETFKKFFSNGVFPSPGDALQIGKGDSGLTVTVNPGIAIINGSMGGIEGDDPLTLTLDTEAPKGNIAYAIMLRYDNTNERRSLYFNVVRGDASSTPQPPTPDTTTPGVYEIRLGYVTVPSNATDLTDATVTNEKGLDACPFAAPFEKIDMSGVTADARASASTALENLQAYIQTNMEFIDSAIDGTTAGNLQSQINSLKQQLDAFDLSGSVDNETIEFTQELGESIKLLRVKDEGLQTVHYADGSVTYAKLADDVDQAISKPKVGKEIAAYSWDELITMAKDPEMVTQIGYLVGQSRLLNISGYSSVDFQLVGINHHDLVGGGKAPMTFMGVLALTNNQMNTASTTSGGWASTSMRSWLNSTIKNAFPEYMSAYLKQVKVPYCETSGGTVNTCNDYLFLASSLELTGQSNQGGAEGEQLEYWAQNNNNAARVKTLITGGNTVSWWLRSVHSSGNFWYVSAKGSLNDNYANNKLGVVLCFCIG